MNGVCLHTRELCVGYGRTTLIGGIELTLRRGEIMTLIGPNGAGKSTILKSVIRQLPLTGGAVYLDGKDMAALGERDVARRLSVLMTAHLRPELMTCFDVAATGRYPYTGRLGILTREDREKTARSLELVHAANLADRDFSRISDGQRQRVLLARALNQEPEVLVLDEPTAGLDPAGRENLMANIQDYHRLRGGTVILVSHSMDEIARNADRILVLKNAHILMDGTPAQVFARAEELLGAGLDVPQITRVAMALAKRGVPVDPAVYTPEDLERQLLALGKGGAPC